MHSAWKSFIYSLESWLHAFNYLCIQKYFPFRTPKQQRRIRWDNSKSTDLGLDDGWFEFGRVWLELGKKNITSISILHQLALSILSYFIVNRRKRNRIVIVDGQDFILKNIQGNDILRRCSHYMSECTNAVNIHQSLPLIVLRSANRHTFQQQIWWSPGAQETRSSSV